MVMAVSHILLHKNTSLALHLMKITVTIVFVVGLFIASAKPYGQIRTASQAQEAIDAVQNIKISALEVSVQSIRDDNRRITDKMDGMKTSLDEARGTAKSVGGLLIIINIIQAILQFKSRLAPNGNNQEKK